MTDDILDRAQALLDEVVDDPRLIHLHSSGYVVATIRDLVDALRAARTENEQMYGFINRLGHPHMCEHPHAAPGDTWQCPNCQRTWRALEWGPLDIRWETTR